MPSPTQPSPYSNVGLSGDTQIDSLIHGTKWGGALGSGASLSYSFLSYRSRFAVDYSYDNEYRNAFILTGRQQGAAIDALQEWSAVANLKFDRVIDSSTQAGTLRFGGYNAMDRDSAAWAYLPGGSPVSGDIWLSPDTGSRPTPGDFDYHTLVHEIGHALGLKHPFETSGVSSVSLAGTVYDDVRYTVMSYNDPYYFEPTGPMLIDIAAIQYLYGANMKWQTGNNTYRWDSNTSIFETIWDAGGIDTIDGSNQAGAVALNLNAGSFSTIGKAFWNGSAYINNCLAIAYGAQIENATGSKFNDTLIGNDLNNILNGLAGADVMHGGNGSDVYYVDNAFDVVIETQADRSTGGSDTVNSYLSTYSLGSDTENLRLLNTGSANGTGNGLDNVIYAGSGNNYMDGQSGLDTLSYRYASKGVTVSLALTAAQATGGSGSDTLLDFENLNGSKYDDKLTGNQYDNRLYGDAGNDVLNGGQGADILIGGDGNDSYYVDDSGDVVAESNASAATGGTDTVYSYLADYTLGSNVENLRILASGSANSTGNSLNNLIYAGTGDNVMDGGSGNDTLSYRFASLGITMSLGLTAAQATGGSGNDVTLNIENITGSQYHDTLTGNSSANILNGALGNDVLDGGAGADWMIGGDGNDSYYIDNKGDVISETNANKAIGGSDTVLSYLSRYTLGSNLENLQILASGNANGTGNTLNNIIYAGAGNNIMDGGAGTDTASYRHATQGVAVNLSLTSAQATGGSGSDLLLNFESLNGSKYADRLTGNNANNRLSGDDGNDVLNGRMGADSMIGGNGNDIYYVDNTADIVSEANADQTTGGNDTVYSYLTSYTLGGNVENLRVLAGGNATGIGNALNNTIYAGSGNNHLNGGSGEDTLSYVYASRGVSINLGVKTAQATGGSGADIIRSFEKLAGSHYNDNLMGNSAANTLHGNKGNDVLNGGAGDDVLVGGAGTDQLTGAAGADRFEFRALSELGLEGLRDVIRDFDALAGDLIDLSFLDADGSTIGPNEVFTYINDADFSTSNAAGQLRFSNGILYGSIDADADAEFEIQLLGVASLDSSSLIV